MGIVISWGVAASSKSTALSWILTTQGCVSMSSLICILTVIGCLVGREWGSQRLQGVRRNTLHWDERWGEAYIERAFFCSFFFTSSLIWGGRPFVWVGVTPICPCVDLDHMVCSWQMVPLSVFPILDVYLTLISKITHNVSVWKCHNLYCLPAIGGKESFSHRTNIFQSKICSPSVQSTDLVNSFINRLGFITIIQNIAIAQKKLDQC